VAFVAEVDPIRFLPLPIKILKKTLLLVITERTGYSINSPLITAKRTKEITFPFFSLQ
jgi:hypothetical protein